MEYLKLYENFSNPVLDLHKECKNYRYVTQLRNAVKSSLDKLNIGYKVSRDEEIIVYDHDDSTFIIIEVDEIMFREHGRPNGSERRLRYRPSNNRYGDFIREPMVLKNLKELLLIILKRSPEYLTNDVLKKINESSNVLDINKPFKEYSYIKEVEKLITDSFDKLKIPFYLVGSSIIVWDYDNPYHTTIKVTNVLNMSYRGDKEVRVNYHIIGNHIGVETRLSSIKDLLTMIVKRSPEYLTNDVLKKINN